MGVRCGLMWMTHEKCRFAQVFSLGVAFMSPQQSTLYSHPAVTVLCHDATFIHRHLCFLFLLIRSCIYFDEML